MISPSLELALEPLLSLLGHPSQDLGLENDLPRESDLESDRLGRSSSSGVGEGNLTSCGAITSDSADPLALVAVWFWVRYVLSSSGMVCER